MIIIKAIRKKPSGEDRWDDIGLGFKNHDGSINLMFFYFPTDPNTKIQLRYEKKNIQADKDEILATD